MAQAVGTSSRGKSSLIPRLSWPGGTKIIAANSTISASSGDQGRTVLRPQLFERFLTGSVPQTSFTNENSLEAFDCAPNRMTLCSLLHPSLPLTQSKQAMQPTSTQQSSSPVVSIQRICRKPEHSFQEPQPLAHMCRFQAKQRHGTDGEKTSYTSELKFKLRTAPVDFGEGISPSASAHCRSAANLSEAAGRSRMTGMARKTCSGRKAAADQQHPTASPRSDCLSQAFPASAEPAPLRLSLILPKSQQNHQMPLRRCSFPERKNGRSELTSHLHSSFMQYEHQGGDTARATAQTAHRKGSQRGLQLKHSLTAQHKLQECLKNADFAAEERLARTSCMPNLNSGGIRGTPQMLEKSNVRCLLKGDKAAAAQANALVRGKAALTGVRARAEVQKHRGKTTATVKQPPVAAVGPAETAFHSPLVTKCSSLQRSVLDCTEHVQCLLGAISSSSPLRKRQPSQEANPLPTPPATIAQEKVEVGAHAERETATTAAATPPASQAGGPTMAVRKTETQAGNSISAKSLISELNVPQSSQTSAESPQSPRFAGKAYQNCGEPTGEEDVEDTAKEFALLRHSEVSFVCVRTLVSYLATCCTISHFGSDDQQQQLNDLSTSPFHCSSSPQIGLEEYLVKRIFRHGEQSINEGVMAVALLSRFLCKQNALLAAALRENSQQQRQRKHFDKCNRDAKNRDKDTGSGSVISTAATATEGFAATAARIGYIEFNYLTAHRLLLTAAFLARKTHRDDHTSIRHWAQLGGVPVEDLVEAESAFVQVVDWLMQYFVYTFFNKCQATLRCWIRLDERVQVTLEDFFGTALAISRRDPRLLGKQGELHPVRGNAATTAVYIREHFQLMQQQDGPTPPTFRDLQARKRLQQKAGLDKMQLHQAEGVFTCCMCSSCCILQSGQPKQWDVGLPFADLAPSSGNSASQGVKDVLNRSEPIDSPLAYDSKDFLDTACLQTGSRIDPLDLPGSPSGAARAANLIRTDTAKAGTIWKLNRSSGQLEYTATSNSCPSCPGEDSSSSLSASKKQHDSSCCIRQEEKLQNKGQGCCKVNAHPFRIVKKEERIAPAAHTDPTAGLVPPH